MKPLHWVCASMLVIIIAVLAFVAGCVVAWYNIEGPIDEYEIASSSLETLTCGNEHLKRAIVDLSEDSDLSSGKVLKIYDEVEKYRTASELRCSGMALTSVGSNELVAIEYYVFEDADGDRFFGVSYP